VKKKKVIVPDDSDFFEKIVAAARADGDDFIIPKDARDELLQVSKYIEMPKEFAVGLIGAPGIPCGLITEVYGAPDSGKTTFCTEILKQCQQQGGVPVLLLSELKYDLPRAEMMGLDVRRMMIKRPRTIEQVKEHIHDIVTYVKKVKSDKPMTIVWDSLAATPCENELNEKRGDFGADQAKAITGVLRKTQAMIRDHNIAFVMINQISSKIGVTFGKKTQAKGGFAPKFYSALRLEFVKIGRLREAGVKTGDFCAIKTKIEAEKNHLGVPFKTIEVAIDRKGFVFDRDVEK
jgi:recombination protein RecA